MPGVVPAGSPGVPPRPGPAGRQSGFTLFELMVVMVIVALMMTMAVLSVDLAGVDGRIKEETRRLDLLLKMAAEEAELSFREIGLMMAREGYAFVHLVPEDASGDMLTLEGGTRWTLMDPTGPFRPRRFPPGIRVVLRLEGQDEADWDVRQPLDRRFPMASDIDPQPLVRRLSVLLAHLASGRQRAAGDDAPAAGILTAWALQNTPDPTEYAALDDEIRLDVPHVIHYSSGESSPFALTLMRDKENTGYRLIGNMVGQRVMQHFTVKEDPSELDGAALELFDALYGDAPREDGRYAPY